MGCHVLLQGIFLAQEWNPCLMSPASAGQFFTNSAMWETLVLSGAQSKSNSPAAAPDYSTGSLAPWFVQLGRSHGVRLFCGRERCQVNLLYIPVRATTQYEGSGNR